MKLRTNIIAIFTTIVVLFLISCDKIENPVVPESEFDWGLYPDPDTTTYPVIVWTQNSNIQRNVLLEDYTGHTCVNCPSYNAIASNIENSYGGKVIVMSVHAHANDAFQLPELPDLPLDHRTVAGNAYAVAMDITSNPLGTINRKKSNIDEYWFLSSDWQTEINIELVKSPDFNLQAQYNYYEETNGLFLHTEIEALNNVVGNYSLINFLVRDSVVAAQIDQGGVLIEDYDHHAVLSGNINGIWGTAVVNGNISSGSKLYHRFSYELPDPSEDTTYRVNNLSIISAICDRDNYEILQVIKTPLAP